MEIVLNLISWTCLLAGSFFAIVGGLGIVRLPDFYTRLHGGGVTDTMGAGLILIGLMFQAALQLVQSGLDPNTIRATIKLGMILTFLLITSPTACHALAQAAVNQALKPFEPDTQDK